MTRDEVANICKAMSDSNRLNSIDIDSLLHLMTIQITLKT